jgi:hypothetical protein
MIESIPLAIGRYAGQHHPPAIAIPVTVEMEAHLQRASIDRLDRLDVEGT